MQGACPAWALLCVLTQSQMQEVDPSLASFTCTFQLPELAVSLRTRTPAWQFKPDHLHWCLGLRRISLSQATPYRGGWAVPRPPTSSPRGQRQAPSPAPTQMPTGLTSAPQANLLKMSPT